MGVKDLWTILAPVKREKSLTDLAGLRLAVDLSGWVCQAETTKVTILTDTYTIKVLSNLQYQKNNSELRLALPLESLRCQFSYLWLYFVLHN